MFLKKAFPGSIVICLIVVKTVLCFQLTLAIKAAQQDNVKHQCVMYGICDGSSVKPNTNFTCMYNGPPKKIEFEGLEILKNVCPELVEKFGDELCCSPDQVQHLITSLQLPQAFLSRCPSCFYNFRQSFCELACGPTQSLYLNVTKVINYTRDPDIFAVTEVQFYVDDAYVQQTYDSCKDVLLDGTKVHVMDILCGPWGAATCTAQRWYNYMGNASNGYRYSTFDIVYNYADGSDTGPSTPFLPEKLFKCNERVNNETMTCSCMDCEPACLPSSPRPFLSPSASQKIMEMSQLTNLLGILGVIGNVALALMVGQANAPDHADDDD